MLKIPTMIVVLFFSRIQFLLAGLLGKYILVIFNQIRRRPLIIKKERINFINFFNIY